MNKEEVFKLANSGVEEYKEHSPKLDFAENVLANIQYEVIGKRKKIETYFKSLDIAYKMKRPEIMYSNIMTLGEIIKSTELTKEEENKYHEKMIQKTRQYLSFFSI